MKPQPGQRWLFEDNFTKFVTEICYLKDQKDYAVIHQVVQIFHCYKETRTELDKLYCSFLLTKDGPIACSDANPHCGIKNCKCKWTYLEGQDAVIKLEVGQRWLYDFCGEKFILQVNKTVPKQYEIIQVFTGGYTKGHINNHWNIFTGSGWEYLEGQDAAL